MKALTHEQALSPDLTRPQIGPVRTQSDLEEALAGPLSVGVVWDAYPSAALPCGPRSRQRRGECELAVLRERGVFWAVDKYLSRPWTRGAKTVYIQGRVKTSPAYVILQFMHCLSVKSEKTPY